MSGQWQPIETAPRDGTKFLIWDSLHKECFTACFSDDELYWEYTRTDKHVPQWWQALPGAPETD